MINKLLAAYPDTVWKNRKTAIVTGVRDEQDPKICLMGACQFVSLEYLIAYEDFGLDVIILSQVLESILDDTRLLRVLIEKLTPRGVIAIHIPAYRVQHKTIHFDHCNNGNWHCYGRDVNQHWADIFEPYATQFIELTDVDTRVPETWFVAGRSLANLEVLHRSIPFQARLNVKSANYSWDPLQLQFAPLCEEFEIWQENGKACHFWWRDDDAIRYTPALIKLAALADKFEAQVLTAVIPALVDKQLSEQVKEIKSLVFCQHGYQHKNHQSATQLKSEFGVERDINEMLKELSAGKAILTEFFKDRFVPVLVPPWNRISPELERFLPELGFRGLSKYDENPELSPLKLTIVNTHLDILDWSATPTIECQSIELLVDRIVQGLIKRRHGEVQEPLGILTHHRVMGQDAWDFMRGLLQAGRAYDCVQWLQPERLF